MTEPGRKEDSEESKKPNPTQEAGEDTNNLTNEIKQKLGLGASAASVVSDGFSRASTNVNPSTTPVVDGFTNVKSRQNPSENTSSSGRTIQLDCRPCGGCCGRWSSGPRVSVDDYEFIKLVTKELGLRAECEVVNRLCSLLRGRGRGGGDVDDVRLLKEILSLLGKVVGSEKAGSRELVYKPGYLIVRLLDAPADYADFYVVLALYGEYVANQLRDYVRGTVHGISLPDLNGFANHEFVINLARELGFNDVLELSRYLKALLDSELASVYPVTKDDKKRGKVSMDEVRSVTCRLCLEEIPAKGKTSEFTRALVRHFRDGHGLRTIEDVEAKARELADKEAVRESRFIDPNLLRLMLARLTDVVIGMASRLNLVGFTEDGYVCGLCSRKFTNEFELAEHLASYHYAELAEQPQPGTE